MRTPEQIWEDADLPTRRLAGLALNPSASVDVLLRLLADAPPAVRMVLCRDRDLPLAVVDAVVEHPDRRTRGFFAANPHVDPAQRARLLHDQDWFVRGHLADGPLVSFPHRPRPLPDEAIVHMICAYEAEHLGSYRFHQQMSAALIQSMPTHPVPEVRCWGVSGWGQLPADTRAVLLADPDDSVRERAQNHARYEDPAWVESVLPARPCHGRTDILLQRALSRAVVDSVLTAPAQPDERATIAGNPTLPPDVVVLLAADPDPKVRERIARRPDLRPTERRALVDDADPEVRRAAAHHPDLGPAERAALAADPDPGVRLAVSVHPALTEEERARIDYEVPMDGRFGFRHVSVRPEPRDPEAVRRKALSGHPMLRREAAEDRALPTDLVARLAEDDDLGVRVLLAQNHPEAPEALLLRSFLEYTGPERENLIARPNFPHAGLAALADHEDPRVRALAARDPDTAPATAERLTRDPDPDVRVALARHPNLPRPRLAELLHDEELAHAAAANPALDPATIDRLLTTDGRSPDADPGPAA
ncbi:hypothetical protein J2Z21_005065 [Streptomyces griseochromogenes]|uniref:Leucine rich repeat variant n=1 Tax=Streptomyces griseochromogenes TaxID=68214 RepID=A0A1B1AWS5_9ACTN|nr:hypothetical protein [Streptomyces griseochromogenes]ANP50991.1 hypothetical protein AVL59_16380 [Streptomyces griseochromogenes]MBP2052083.1 hypothetical protein [Streptomyces griseochromogenes]